MTVESREALARWRALPHAVQLARLRCPEPEPARPGLLAMAADLAGSVAELIRDGGRVASLEIQAEREAACRACEYHDHEEDACRACGCGTIRAIAAVGLDLDLKRSWASSRCPADPPRWGPV